MPQHIAVESGRHARRIVVGGFEHVHILGQVDANQQATIVVDQLAHVGQQVERVGRVKVADGRAGVEHQPPGARNVVGQGHALSHVAADGPCIQAGEVVAQALHRRLQKIGRNIHPHKTRRLHQPAQGAGLLAVARAQLDQRAPHAHGAGNVGRMLLHERGFGAGGVVLGQAGDFLEQAGAVLVVEIFGRNARGPLVQATCDVVGGAGQRHG